MRRRFLAAPPVQPMLILFDQGVPRGLAASLGSHNVTEARKPGWERISFQRNLADRKISIVVLGQSPWWLVRQHLDAIVAVVNAPMPGSYAEVDIPFRR